MESGANVRIFSARGREYKFINNICHKSEGKGPFGKPWISCCGKNVTESK